MSRGLLLSFLLVGSALAQVPAPSATTDGRKLVQVSVEFIEVPANEANRLLIKEKLGKDGVKLHAELQSLMDHEKADSLETMLVTSTSGQKATTESVREVIYPAEWEPIDLPTDRPLTVEEQKAKPPVPRYFPPVPTAFQTRNTGTNLEIEPSLSEDTKSIHLRLVPEIVLEAGTSRWNPYKDELGNESVVTQPVFYSLRTNTAITSGDGVPVLLSVLTPMTKEGVPDHSRKLFVIVTSDVVDATAAK